jgi:hypothetical protein
MLSLPFGLPSNRIPAIRAGRAKLTPDQVALLRSDNVVSGASRRVDLKGSITPDLIEAIARNISGASAPPGNSRRRARRRSPES